LERIFKVASTGRWRFDPTQNTFLEHMKAKTDSLLYRGKHTQHT
jgi:hypothetical protein